MRVREEYCNMVLLAAVMLLSAAIAVIAGWLDGPQTASAKAPAYFARPTPVRVVGAPFVPNVNPSARQ